MTAPSPADPTAVMGRRIGAFVVDLVIVAAVLVLAARFIADFQRETIPSAFAGRDDVCDIVEQSQTVTMCFTNDDVVFYATGADAESSMLGLPVLVSFLNSVVLAAATGASVGKHAFGLRVVRNGSAAPAGLARHLVRWVLWVVDAFPWFVPLVGLVAGFIVPRHRRVGDLVAGTAVVARSSAGRPFAMVADGEPMSAWPGPAEMPPEATATDPWANAAPSYPPIYPPIDPAAGDGEPTPAPDAAPLDAAPLDAAPLDAALLDAALLDAAPLDASPLGVPETWSAEEWTARTSSAQAASEQTWSAQTWDAERATAQAERTDPVGAEPEPATDATDAADLPTTGPQWDAARNAYIQWEPVSGQWMQYDDLAKTWRPLS